MEFEYGEKYYRKREDKVHYHYMAATAMRLCELASVRCESVLDVGCASGPFLKAMRALYPAAILTGIDCGDIPRNRWMLAGDEKAYFWPFDLDKAEASCASVCSPFDFVCFFEVIEHISPSNESNLVAFVSALTGGIMMFTGAGEGQRGYGHLNCRPKEHWIEEFGKAGLPCDAGLTDAAKGVFRAFDIPFEKNLLVFRKPVPQA